DRQEVDARLAEEIVSAPPQFSVGAGGGRDWLRHLLLAPSSGGDRVADHQLRSVHSTDYPLPGGARWASRLCAVYDQKATRPGCAQRSAESLVAPTESRTDMRRLISL